MTSTSYVWNAPKGGNWSDAVNWTPNGVPGATDTATFGYYLTAATTVNLDISPTIAALTIFNPSRGTNTLEISGQSLTVSGVLKLYTNTKIVGYGSITAGSYFGAGGTLEASGGTLALNGPVTYGNVLAIDDQQSSGSELLINGAAVAYRAIVLDNSNQTLAIGAGGSLKIMQDQGYGAGTILLQGGSLSDAVLEVDDAGQLTGYGAVQTVRGSGAVTAVGGALTFANAVDGVGAVTRFHIGASGDLVFQGAVGTAVINPTVTFDSTVATLDTRLVAANNLHLGTLTDFQAGDQFLVQAFSSGDTVSFDLNTEKLTVLSSNGGKSETFQLAGTYDANTTFNIKHIGTSDTITTNAVICFMAGTMIRTPDGEVAVETLAPGDLVMTTDDAAKPVAWLGKQTVSMVFADPLRSLPVRVRAGALGENVPARDLLISPDHALLVDGVLIHAGALINGTSILRETAVPQVFVYYHVELDDHSLILAENAPAETFVDNIDRLNFDNWAEHEALYPDGKPIMELPYPRAKGRRQVPVDIRVALAERAQLLGFVEADVAVA
jgi:hypothetical protein